MRFRRRLSEVEAMQWDGNNFDELQSFVGENVQLTYNIEAETIFIGAGRGLQYVKPDDWIVKGGFGDIIAMQDAVFRSNYELMNEPAIG